VLPDSDYCEEHSKVKCGSCGAQATHQCEETGQFVCGCPLCNDCVHSIVVEGHNGGVGFYSVGTKPETLKIHDKKANQIYKPWYMRKRFTHQVVEGNLRRFTGELDECQDFIIKYADQLRREQQAFKVVPLTENEIQALKTDDALHTTETLKELYGL
jgi:hypothetical protein